MNFVIPMAGRGQRFFEAGYSVPKPLLKAHGKTLLQWSVDSLPLELCQRLLFIGLEEMRAELEPLIAETYAEYAPRFAWLKETTRGQAETVYLASAHFLEQQPLLIFNIDTCFDSPTLKNTLLEAPYDGVLGGFESTEDRFSFARLGQAGYVEEVQEKEAISSNALTGLYHFTQVSDFIESFESALHKDARVKGEFYIAPLYNCLIKEGKRFVLDKAKEHFILGTPGEYKHFCALKIS